MVSPAERPFAFLRFSEKTQAPRRAVPRNRHESHPDSDRLIACGNGRGSGFFRGRSDPQREASREAPLQERASRVRPGCRSATLQLTIPREV
jgi:hypothetical protein